MSSTPLPKNSPAQPPRLWRKIGIASAIMMASIFLSRVMGLVREMVIAGVAGAVVTHRTAAAAGGVLLAAHRFRRALGRQYDDWNGGPLGSLAKTKRA